MRQGLVQIYSGDGKGKTTAASGLALRALGHGWRVLLVRLLKGRAGDAGEVAVLRRLGVEIVEAAVGTVIGTPPRTTVVASVAAAMTTARELLARDRFDLVIFDELNPAVARGYLPLAEVLDLLAQRPASLEIVLTGRHAPPELLECADLVTVMQCHKHPYAAGVAARPGIEY